VRAAGASPSFTVNADKPGKGNFVVRVNGEAVVSLVAMARPFNKLRELDIAAAGAAVAAKLGGGGGKAAAAAPAAAASAAAEPAAAAPPAAKKARKA